jgi:hypothetical protein
LKSNLFVSGSAGEASTFSYSLPEGKEETVPLQRQTSYFLLNDTSTQAIEGKNRGVYPLPIHRGSETHPAFTIVSSDFPPVRETIGGPKNHHLHPFFV